MSYLRQMIETHPARANVELDALQRVTESLMNCAQTCMACADACISEAECEMLRSCIRLNLDCADICEVTLRSLSRQTEPSWPLWQSLLNTCVTACQVCGQICREHAAKHEHCRICADVCHQCEENCQWMLRAVAGRS